MDLQSADALLPVSFAAQIKPYDSVPSNNLHKILLFSKNIDLLSDLYFYTQNHNLLVEACNEVRELVSRAHRFRPDILLVDEDTYVFSEAFPDAAKVIKAILNIRVILLVKDPAGVAFNDAVVDEARFLSNSVIMDLFK